ncbi:MAG: YaiO family outer membrane beta-barrel protein [Flavobacteriales bacterium]|nr:YaiO family outer membrane beta-barrel protein [Flavobacteriales bacterium]
MRILLHILTWFFWCTQVQGQSVSKPPDPLKTARLYVSLGQFNKAIENLDSVLAKNPELQAAHILKTRLLIWSRKYSEAASALSQYRQIFPDAFEPQKLEILLLQNEKKYEKAVEKGTPLMEDCTDEELFNILLNVASAQKNLLLRETILKKAESNGLAGWVKDMRALASIRLTEERSTLQEAVRQINEYLPQAHNKFIFRIERLKNYLWMRDYQKAEKELDSLEILYPEETNGLARWHIQAYVLRNEHKRAFEYGNPLVPFNNDEDYHILLLNSALKYGNKRAADSLRQVIKKEFNPDFDLFDTVKARVLRMASERKFAEAEKLVDSVLRNKSPDARYEILKCRIKSWSGKMDTALVLSSRLYELYPYDSEVRELHATQLFWNEKFAEALQVGLPVLQKVQAAEFNKTMVEAALGAKKFDLADSLIRVSQRDYPSDKRFQEIQFHKEYVQYNRHGAARYVIDFFDNNQRPWHLLSLEYGSRTKKFSFATRLNIANRFGNQNAFQLEGDFYAPLAKRWNGFANVAVSPYRIFPYARITLEPSFSFGRHYDVSLGVSYIRFDQKNLLVFSPQMGFSFGKFWGSARFFYIVDTPRPQYAAMAQVRWFFRNPDEYIGLIGSYGALFLQQITPGQFDITNTSRFALIAQARIAPTWYINPLAGYAPRDFDREGQFQRITVQMGIMKKF